MIAIVDYGSGNIRAIANVYSRLNIAVKVAKRPEELDGCTKILLPGVGAFDQAMGQLEASGFRRRLDRLVLQDRVPVLGICVGMQILAHGSEEGVRGGLGWIDGQVKRLDVSQLTQATQLPHMGWNDVSPVKGGGLFQGLENGSRFYFLHSFHFVCRQPANVIASCEYGSSFACAVRECNIHGVQFHPEKSHSFGVQLLKNFASL
jgi:glutamine amidotransferase